MKLSFSKIDIPAPIKITFKVIISAIIIFLIVRKIDEHLLWTVVAHADPPWLVWAVGWFMLSKVISAYRFKGLIAATDIHLPAKENLRLYWLGMYYNLLLPGGISGDGYKIKWLMDRYGKPFKRILTITFFDRISGLMALIQLSLLLMLWVMGSQPYGILWISLFILSIPTSWFLFRLMVNKEFRIWMITSLQSLGVQLAQAVTAIGLVLALGLTGFWADYLLLFMVSSLVAMVPLTLGGAGARELTFLYGAQFLHIHEEKAVAIGFLFYAISTCVSLLGMLFSFRKKRDGIEVPA